MFAPKPSATAATTAPAAGRVQTQLPWIEKYRPKHMDDVAHQEEVVRVLKKTLESKNLPHLLFYGPPGTGKTSTVLALARELFGPDLMKKRVLELNASDERGIKVIREKVKNFSQTAVGEGSASATGEYPCPPFKIIILDEADSLTKDAQSALRRIMEAHSRITRFCIICNYVSRIIEPLASRCAKFRFKPLDDATAKSRLQMICDAEHVVFAPHALDELLRVSDGDLRKAIMYLQNAKRVYGSRQLTDDVFVDMSGLIPDDVVLRLLDACEHKAFDDVEQVVRDIIVEGYSVAQLIHQILDKITGDSVFTDRQRAIVSQRLGQIDKYLIDGADEHLQLMDLATLMMQVFQRHA